MRSTRLTILLFWCTLLFAGTTHVVVDAQRAIVNLGKRLKNPFRRSNNRKQPDAIGEEDPTEPRDVRWWMWGGAIVLLSGVVSCGIITATTNPETDEVQQIEEKLLDGYGEPMDVSFEMIGLELKKRNSGGSNNKIILDGSIQGRARPGRMLAIMGPSGAGKSSLLHAVAGRIKDNKNLQLTGKRYLNNVEITGDSQLPCAFIEQSTLFFPHMTVRETLEFRVALKLGHVRHKHEIVNAILAQLGLTNVADTVVGDDKVRGISGGERKRLSIAVEMVSSPDLIFLDEPTSGLDSTAATTLVTTLRELADAGKTIVAVIHQPSQHVFNIFDDILLISEGRQMYYGPRSEVRHYMEMHGCKPETEMGTAEHILDCISKQPIDRESIEDAESRLESLATRASQSLMVHTNVAQKRKLVNNNTVRANIFTQFRLLLSRALRELFRGRVTILLKLVQQVSTALIYGGIYSLGTNQASIQDRYGLLSLIAIGGMNMAMAQTIRSFPREKTIVSNELASNMYQTLPYFIGKAISELPMVGFYNSLFGAAVYFLTGLNRAPGKLANFLGLLSLHGVVSQAAGLLIGAISPNSDVALAMFPAVVVINIIFDGRNISEENTPGFLRWIPKVGLIKWGFEGLCLNEFEGLEFETGGPRRGPVAKTGADALARFGLGTRTLGEVVRAQLFIASGSWLLSYLGFTLTRQRYQEMKTPQKEKMD